jgi:pyruvate ferredoxin oxidoreductase alpha subunit
VLATDVALVVQGSNSKVFSVVAGLGGRAITRRSLEDLLAQSARGDLNSLTFLDLDGAAVDRERTRMANTRRSGPSAENLLRDVGTEHAASKVKS